jgi:hypothetical protein
VPFILGVFIAPVGLYIRRQLPETIGANERHPSATAVLSNLMRHHWRAVMFGILIICGGTMLLMPHAEVVHERVGQPNPSFASTGHGVTETRS